MGSDSQLGIRRDDASIVAARSMPASRGTAVITWNVVMSTFPTIDALQRAVNACPAGEYLRAERRDYCDCRDDDQAGDQRVLDHFATVVIVPKTFHQLHDCSTEKDVVLFHRTRVVLKTTGPGPNDIRCGR